MEYHKNSFLAGLAVGKQLKGWSNSSGGTPGPTPGPDVINFGIIFGYGTESMQIEIAQFIEPICGFSEESI